MEVVFFAQLELRKKLRKDMMSSSRDVGKLHVNVWKRTWRINGNKVSKCAVQYF